MEERGKNGDNTTFDNDEVYEHRHIDDGEAWGRY